MASTTEPAALRPPWAALGAAVGLAALFGVGCSAAGGPGAAAPRGPSPGPDGGAPAAAGPDAGGDAALEADRAGDAARSEPPRPFRCIAEALLLRCGEGEGGEACEGVRVRGPGGGMGREAAEADALEACGEAVRLAGEAEPLREASPCEVTSCGPPALGGLPPRARVRLGNAAVVEGQGSLSAEDARGPLARRVSELSRCYRARLASEPTEALRLDVRLAVDAAGRVTRAEVPTPGVDPESVTCVVSALDGLDLPPPRGGAVVLEVEMAFQPLGPAPSSETIRKGDASR